MTDFTVPDEPPPDAFEWTAEPGDPDAAGMPGEFVTDPADEDGSGDAVPGVRRGTPKEAFDSESNN